MDALRIIRLDAAMDVAAASALAAAAGYASQALLPSPAGAFVVALAFAGCLFALRSVPDGQRGFALAAFEPQPIPCEPELVLTEADRVEPSDRHELVLDDVLGALAPDSRVVRLFDRAAMPTPGELRGRIEHHLAATPAASADASRELLQALADLRRSLR